MDDDYDACAAYQLRADLIAERARCVALEARVRDLGRTVEQLQIALFDTISAGSAAPFRGAPASRPEDEALQAACREGCSVEDVVRLVEAGAEPRADGSMALLWCVERGDVECAEALVRFGADPRALDGCAERMAVRRGDVRMLAALGPGRSPGVQTSSSSAKEPLLKAETVITMDQMRVSSATTHDHS